MFATWIRLNIYMLAKKKHIKNLGILLEQHQNQVYLQHGAKKVTRIINFGCPYEDNHKTSSNTEFSL